jgi:hypothetical protein
LAGCAFVAFLLLWIAMPETAAFPPRAVYRYGKAPAVAD